MIHTWDTMADQKVVQQWFFYSAGIRDPTTPALYIAAIGTTLLHTAILDNPLRAKILHRHYSEQPALLRTFLHRLIPSVPSEFTGTIADNHHYSTRTI